MKISRSVFHWAVSIFLTLHVSAADQVYSGPQVSEKTTSFKVFDLTPGRGAGERDPVAENGGAPTALVFVHAIERSLVPLLRVIDRYGALRSNRIRTEVVFLFGDRLQGEPRVKAASGSLKLASRIGLSLDGAEGPGNYGLNKDCMMTIVAAKENRVTATFALVQPGIADAPKVIEALARTCGDESPPSVEELSGPAVSMRESTRRPERGGARESSLETTPPGKVEEKFPGAVPSDGRLNGLLRRLIRPTNDEATVNALRDEMQSYVKDNKELTQQAIDGWIRVLHFGDHYGTAYSRQIGREMLEQLKANQTTP